MSKQNIISEVNVRDKSHVTLFDTLLEFVGHKDLWLFIGLSIGIATWLLATGPTYMDLIWFSVGMIIFIPQQYFVHVYILHAPMPKSQRAYLYMYRLHFGHHDFPKRHDLLYMPIWLILPFMIFNIMLIWLITPELRAFMAVYFGALIAYIINEWAHLLCHVPYIPKSKLWRKMVKLHALHHFYDEKNWYAVTLDVMDKIFKTTPNFEKISRSDSCRYLGLNEQHPWLTHARAHFASRSTGNISCSKMWMTTDSRGEESHG